MLEVCGQHRYRDDALVWHYRQANKLATVRWGECRKDIESARQYFLDKAERELPFVEQQYMSILRSSTTAEETPNDKGEAYATDFLNGYTADFVGATVLRWDELYRQYWRKFWSGF
jgi:hypothetical protein